MPPSLPPSLPPFPFPVPSRPFRSCPFPAPFLSLAFWFVDDFPVQSCENRGSTRLDATQLRASVTNVEIVEADARVICVSNKIKHLFEFNVKVKFSLTIDESMGLQPPAEVCAFVRVS